MQGKVFSELTAPITAFVANAGSKIDEKSDSKTLFFEDFTNILVFGISIGAPSMRKLLKELETNSSAKELGLPKVAYSTFRDGFTRFNIQYFKDLYTHVYQSFEWLEVGEFRNLGKFKAVDGSLFPTLRSMEWANYKTHFKALKLHLAFNLNDCCPNEFLISEGNHSERLFLISILEKDVTYICDRGYFSFSVLDSINEKRALFLFRLKDNIKYNVGTTLKLTGELPTCFSHITDELVQFDSDKERKVYRIVRFRVLNSHFILCTNRFDLTTLQVIMLYAYRWQIELMFKFLKRTLKGLHLLAQTEESSQVHFYMLLITAMLQLRLRQTFLMKSMPINTDKLDNSVKIEDSDINNLTNSTINKKYTGTAPNKWMASLNIIFKKGFKISSDWLLYIKNFISKDIDYQIITTFNSV
jgi:hypothetical protein